jgi:hypothetical protein
VNLQQANHHLQKHKALKIDNWSNVMMNLISGAIARISSLLKGLQVKRFLAVVVVGFVLLTNATTNTYPEQNKGLSQEVRDWAHQEGNSGKQSQRPRTSGEWEAEANQDASLGERVKQIGEDSAEAFRDFGSTYPDTAKRSGNSLRNGDAS